MSGFHVDPGFKGKLKFGVYNAGANKVTIDADTPIFSIWFCKFLEETKDGYNGHWVGTEAITAEDVTKLQGEVSSPGQLRIELNQIRSKITNLNYVLTAIATLLISVTALTIITLLRTWINS